MAPTLDGRQAVAIFELCLRGIEIADSDNDVIDLYVRIRHRHILPRSAERRAERHEASFTMMVPLVVAAHGIRAASGGAVMMMGPPKRV